MTTLRHLATWAGEGGGGAALDCCAAAAAAPDEDESEAGCDEFAAAATAALALADVDGCWLFKLAVVTVPVVDEEDGGKESTDTNCCGRGLTGLRKKFPSRTPDG